jgi:hypothetical protein
MRAALLLPLLLLAPAAHAQWQILDSNTTADLRGIDNVGKGVVWASGSNGTVLRSEDAGFEWQPCTIPPNAEHLDFRGIQAFDANTAIVMSSGKGPLSRLYKTTDGCQTWTLLFTNSDKGGFWDAIKTNQADGVLLGDPVDGHFKIWRINLDSPTQPAVPTGHRQPGANDGETAFAASNSALFVENAFFFFWIGTGGPGGAHVIRRTNHDFDSFGFDTYSAVSVPIGKHTDSSGVFSLSFRPHTPSDAHETAFLAGVAVGGDYKMPDSSEEIAAWTQDGGKKWMASLSQPHGYRSAVAYDAAHKLWITVGPNGTDISTDDGRNWRALHPDPALHDPPEADRNWNALSLPFVVGPKGRIGLLKPSALATASH